MPRLTSSPLHRADFERTACGVGFVAKNAALKRLANLAENIALEGAEDFGVGMFLQWENFKVAAA